MSQNVVPKDMNKSNETILRQDFYVEIRML